MATSTGGQRVSDVIINDHRELSEYYNNIKNATDPETKIQWQNQFTWELARHSIGEELVVYPAMEKYMGDKGKEMAEKDRKEHRSVKEALYEFQSLQPTDQSFESTLDKLMADLDHHIREEEEHDLPALEKALADAMPDEASESLAKSFQRTKMFVPTRSHPSSPDRPPFETVVGLMAAPLDKLGDMFRRFPK